MINCLYSFQKKKKRMTNNFLFESVSIIYESHFTCEVIHSRFLGHLLDFLECDAHWLTAGCGSPAIGILCCQDINAPQQLQSDHDDQSAIFLGG